ncbi:EI24 domain-containing protein [Thermosynechococcaceae cyanobacterium BACA0444]|uniref:EI24 domain-containing protein n=1 Tax=Pseudocalidococcus azoricus BACA0444 TaxID=2918990 RepID=A0AAE4FRW3_9CYAN|nr:EI24 domain-containing protein [Pseudocalidococcus azoricus]MDS3860618.1 EI24 domain-containing protein [Pseudocalidococcus azoricus BACA0444]
MGGLLKVPGRMWAGFTAVFRGLGFIARHRLWGYLVLPAGLSFALGLGLLGGSIWLVRHGLAPLAVGLNPAWLTVYDVLTQIIAVLVALFLTLIGYQALLPLLVIPFLGPLLNQTEIILTGEAVEVGWQRDMKNALVGIWFALRDTGLQLLCLGFSLFLGPGQPLFMVVINSYFLGRGSFDYLLEKHNSTLRQRQQQTRQLWPEIQGLGLAQVVGLLLPIVGILLVPASGLVGAALLFYQAQLPFSPKIPELNAPQRT